MAQQTTTVAAGDSTRTYLTADLRRAQRVLIKVLDGDQQVDDVVRAQLAPVVSILTDATKRKRGAS